MSKITGIERPEQLPSKVIAMYDAVKMLMEQGHNAFDLRVSMITGLAGIGKGTAYEYFDTKEELIACALAYQVQGMLTMIQDELSERGSFREQMIYLLKLEERHQHEKEYLMRFLHILTDNTELSRLVQQKMHEYEIACLPGEAASVCVKNPLRNILEGIILQGRERGELRTDQPMEYQIYALAAKLLTYMIYRCETGNIQENTVEMHQLVLKGIMGELQRQQTDIM